MDIMVYVAVAVLIGYLATAINLFGIPRSISETFYLYESMRKGLGYVFTIFMLTEAFLMITPMVHLASFEWWQFLGFLCPTGISFCGCAPLFKENFVKVVHFSGAITGAVTGLAWCFLVNSGLTFVVLSVMGVITIFLSIYTKTEKSCMTFWMELLAFGTIALVLLASTI